MILDNTFFWEKYNTLSSEKEKNLFLKAHLLSLSPQELYQHLLSDIDNLGIGIIDLVAKNGLSQNESNDVSLHIDAIIEQLEQANPIAKAA